MNKQIFSKSAFSALAAASALMLSACDAGVSTDAGEYSAADVDPYLADPAVGDLWAAKLDEFSAREFNVESSGSSSAYGLMKVVEVNDERVMVITENAAWPMASGSLDDLRGDLADIEWDETETIPVNRADIPGLVESDYILETRRMAGE